MNPERLANEYRCRFETNRAYREEVWKVLVEAYFQRLVARSDRVLDLGCGWGEFINQVEAGKKFGLDLNDDAARHLDADVTFLHQPSDERWPIDDGELDVVFTSNFLEHVADRDAILATLHQAHRCLRSGGTIVCLGPNMKVVRGAYWDYFDHLVPLTERSMSEALELSGFTVDGMIARFLPYTMSGRRTPPIAFVRWYLRLPIVWRVLGGQFLVTATRP